MADARKFHVKRELSNPIFGDNKMKLGVFGMNASNGSAMTMAPERHQIDWARDLAVLQAADRMGFEALVPIARWRGFDGKSNLNGVCFESYTWAAGLGASTRYSAVMSTSHVPTIHPIVAAKQAVTVDHISNGRFGLNIVCGWFPQEMEMFNGAMMDHETRYDYAAEWLDIVKMFWSREGYFDYEGRFFNIKKGVAEPKPVQKPFPALMNAGTSPRGKHFAAKNCDMAFSILPPGDMDGARREIESYKAMARDHYNREIQVWCYAYVVQRDTQKEAEDYVRYYAEEYGDDEGVERFIELQGIQTPTAKLGEIDRIRFNIKAGLGAYPIVGTPERIVMTLRELSDAGLDGVTLTWVDYADGIALWERDVMPLMEQAGLRKPFDRSITSKERAALI